MAERRLAFQNDRELQRFVIPGVRPTGRQLGVGSYGTVEELKVNGLVCAGKRLHEALVEQGNAGVADIARKFLLECQVTSGTHKRSASDELCMKKGSYFFAGNGRDAPSSCRPVPGTVFPRRVSTACAGDGATGQQPG